MACNYLSETLRDRDEAGAQYKLDEQDSQSRMHLATILSQSAWCASPLVELQSSNISDEIKSLTA